ncbi:MAG TPA: hypothetical protein VGB55_08980 [Tepidisphaeraceae bacterium]
MSTITKPGQSGYAVSRPEGRCSATGAAIAPGDRFMALVRETATGIERSDFTLEAWPSVDKAGALAYWQCVMPTLDQAKKKVFVDDEVLCSLFERLADAAETAKVHFRFVLGLILMRKRLLAYEGSTSDAGKDIWLVRMRGRTEQLPLIDPKLDQEQMQAVSSQLGEILNEDL